MSLDHRFVFADNMVLRCKCERDEYFPIEILDFEDILGRLKTLFSSRLDTRRDLDTGSTKKEASLKNRLFDSSSKPMTLCDIGDTSAADKTRLGLHEANIKKQDSFVLQVSPLMRHRRKYKNVQNIMEDPKKNNSAIRKTSCSGTSSVYRRRKDILDCLNDNSPDFLHVSTFCDIESAEEFLRFLRDSKTVAIDIYISTDLYISITYQRLINFKQDFMMLDLKRTDFMLFLKPF